MRMENHFFAIWFAFIIQWKSIQLSQFKTVCTTVNQISSDGVQLNHNSRISETKFTWMQVLYFISNMECRNFQYLNKNTTVAPWSRTSELSVQCSIRSKQCSECFVTNQLFLSGGSEKLLKYTIWLCWYNFSAICLY